MLKRLVYQDGLTYTVESPDKLVSLTGSNQLRRLVSLLGRNQLERLVSLLGRNLLGRLVSLFPKTQL